MNRLGVVKAIFVPIISQQLTKWLIIYLKSLEVSLPQPVQQGACAQLPPPVGVLHVGAKLPVQLHQPVVELLPGVAGGLPGKGRLQGTADQGLGQA